MSKLEIDVLVVKSGQHPYKAKIPNNMDSFKALVSPSITFPSDIDFITLERNIVLIYNKEGVLFNLKGNRRIGQQIFAGTFFIAEITDNGYFTSLSIANQEKYIKHFHKIEKYTDREVMNAYWESWLSTTDDI